MREIVIPETVQRCIDVLEGSGYEAYVVGGAVRDCLLGLMPTDFDIATSALPDEIIACFAGYRQVLNGVKHGTVMVIFEDNPIEITTYRVDGNYDDCRHPSEVAFTNSLERDLMRRDFTINAFAYNSKHGFVDLFNGINDLNSKIISVIGDGEKRFKEDALRIMRAFRFSAALGFDIDLKTVKAIEKCATLLKHISIERITSEFCRILCVQNPMSTLTLMKELGVMQQFLDCDITKAVDTSAPQLATRLASIADKCTLRLDHATRDQFDTLIRYKHVTLCGNLADIKRLLNKVGDSAFLQIIDLKQSLGQVIDHAFNAYTVIKKEQHCYTYDGLKLSGADLSNLGYRGADIGRILFNLLNAVVEDNCNNTYEKLLELVYSYDVG